jgi:hypothetical protein
LTVSERISIINQTTTPLSLGIYFIDIGVIVAVTAWIDFIQGNPVISKVMPNP